ncbi:MAG: MBOAT family O-acyltransferase [Bacteroidota bacterium]
MLFNSAHFIVFFIIVTTAYFSLGLKGRLYLLLFASCYFYMVFRPIYILILFFTIVIDYYAGIWIEQSTGSKRKLLLIISLISNIGILAYFKYFNFLNQNLTHLLGYFKVENNIPFLEILLPIGLSFHTFQAMSYTIEVYRGKQPAEQHFGVYALYVMFYPQLVAGPIERPQNILPQLKTFQKYDLENVKSGLLLMAWGLFKKVVIADRLALFVDYAYNQPSEKNGLTLLMATFFYTFQIYCDFSGYSDIAIGSARVMGYNLMENFKSPYFSGSISEFWRRWHISLSSWFRDYLYIPLGGNRKGITRKYLGLFLVFMVSGLWHGAKWTFVVWGSLHGIYLILAALRQSLLPDFAISKSRLFSFLNVLATFIIVMFSWVFFRASGIFDATQIFKKIAQLNFADELPNIMNTNELIFSFILIFALLLKEKFYFSFRPLGSIQFGILFVFLLFLTYFLGVFSNQQFIYFQF